MATRVPTQALEVEEKEELKNLSEKQGAANFCSKFSTFRWNKLMDPFGVTH